MNPISFIINLVRKLSIFALVLVVFALLVIYFVMYHLLGDPNILLGIIVAVLFVINILCKKN